VRTPNAIVPFAGEDIRELYVKNYGSGEATLTMSATLALSHPEMLLVPYVMLFVVGVFVLYLLQRAATPKLAAIALSTAKSGALVGVLISVTTIPAAANIGVAAAYQDWEEWRGAMLQDRGPNVRGEGARRHYRTAAGKSAVLSALRRIPPGDLLQPCSVTSVTSECRDDEQAVISALQPCFIALPGYTAPRECPLEPHPRDRRPSRTWSGRNCLRRRR
jgi:hypothetical protein